MPRVDAEILTPFASRFTAGTRLTAAERAEVLRVAQGFCCKDSAAAGALSPETVRARRKRIYRKLDVDSASGLLSKLLAYALTLLANDERLAPQAGPLERSQADAGSAPAAVG